MALDPTASANHVTLPSEGASPLRKIGRRLLLALGLIVLVAMVTFIGRDGYYDPENDGVSLLDAFYYSTVSITTTGYGDVRPVSDEARLLTTIIVTPARILFLILLVGTTLEILAERSRHAYRVGRWRKRLRGHTIICGYGTKGRSAAKTLLGRGVAAGSIVVIDDSTAGRTRAGDDGLDAIVGDASSQESLAQAGIAEASSVVVAVDRDDSAILITLTARELNPKATIVVAVREEENVHLLHQGGANGVITSSAAAGRLLGLSSETPQVTEVLEDLLTVGEGLDIVEHEVGPDDLRTVTPVPDHGIVLAVVRDGELIRFDDERASELRAGDRVVELRGALTHTRG